MRRYLQRFKDIPPQSSPQGTIGAMTARRHGRRDRFRNPPPDRRPRGNIVTTAAPATRETEIGITLVDKVAVRHFEHSDQSRCLLITNHELYGKDVNIIAKIDDYTNTWAGSVDNEGSLVDVYKLLGSGRISFFLASAYRAPSLDTEITTCDLVGDIFRVFLPYLTNNSSSELKVYNWDVTGPQMNIGTIPEGWKDVLMGNSDNLADLVNGYRSLPGDKVSFVFAVNK
ncbi:hypothetical protein FHETE_10908 [Fusarium heterosporum]|uniref:Uncharacterized protein n=1 Tax=Fusarium heterosporum TaxID=42747 RepID=A0A8H5STA1_FUSHE|nr:hypothetical protein FHETE_10908 [Fusarium heterosporum]